MQKTSPFIEVKSKFLINAHIETVLSQRWDLTDKSRTLLIIFLN